MMDKAIRERDLDALKRANLAAETVNQAGLDRIFVETGKGPIGDAIKNA